MAEIANYPVTYRSPILRRLMSVIFVVIMLMLGYFGRAHLEKSSSKMVWFFAIVGLMVTIISSLNENSSRITLFADRIEKRTWFDTKTWRRDEAVGLWFGLFGGFKLVRKYNQADYFVIPAGIKRDATWQDWLRDVPTANVKPAYPRMFSKHKQSDQAGD